MLQFNHVFQKPIFSQTSRRFIKDAFPARKLQSSSLLFGQTQDFKHVETFNLNSGYRLSRSAGKIYVSVHTRDPVPLQKPVPRKLSIEEMESLVNDLREQIDLLSTYLQEERLRHAGTKKRAVADLVQQKNTLNKKLEEEMENLREFHTEEKQLLQAQLDARLQQSEKEHDKKMEKLQSEYRMLQASFKIYRSNLQDEMQNEIKLKKTEFEWEKKQSVDNAVDQCRKNMEESFSQEREEIRKEFLKNMNELMREHRLELDRMAEKTKSEDEIKQLVKRSEELTVAMGDIEKLKQQLEEFNMKNRDLTVNLNETKKKLATLELHFDDKVQGVEDKHRSFIESLRREKADVTRRLVRSCEDFQVEKIAREVAEKERREAAVKMLKKNLQSIEQNANKLESVAGVSRKPVDLTNQIEEISNILQRIDGANLPAALSEFETLLKRFQKKQRFASQSVLDLSNSNARSEIYRERRRSSGLSRPSRSSSSTFEKRRSVDRKYSGRLKSADDETKPNQATYNQTSTPSRLSSAASKEKSDHSDDFSSLWDSEAFKNNVVEAISSQAKSELDSDSLKDKLANVIFNNVKHHWDSVVLQDMVTETLSCDFNQDIDLESFKSLFTEKILHETKRACDPNSLKPNIGSVVAREVASSFAKDNLKTNLFTIVCTDDKLAQFSLNVKNVVTHVILSTTSAMFRVDSSKARAADTMSEDIKLHADDSSLKRRITGAISDDTLLQLVTDTLQGGGADAKRKLSFLQSENVLPGRAGAKNEKTVLDIAAEEQLPSLDVENKQVSPIDLADEQSTRQETRLEKVLKLGISDAASQDAVMRLDNDALRVRVAHIVSEEVKIFWNDDCFRKKMLDAVLMDSRASSENVYENISSNIIDQSKTDFDGERKHQSSALLHDAKTSDSEAHKLESARESSLLQKVTSKESSALNNVPSVSHITLELTSSITAQDLLLGSRHSLEGKFERKRYEPVTGPSSSKPICERKSSTHRKKSPVSLAKQNKSSRPVSAVSDEAQSKSDENERTSSAYFERNLKDLSPVRVIIEDGANQVVADKDLGRWRGTFLSRDNRARPPIIFDVEAYKTLTANKPDTSNIAQKSPVLKPKNKGGDPEESSVVAPPNSSRGPSPIP